MSEKSELKPWPVDPETGEPATQECSHCGAKAGPTWTSWQCCRYPFGSCDGVMKPLTRPEPEPGDRESQGAFIDDPIREGPPMDLFKRACDWIENIDIQYGPSPHSLAAEFARVRAEERERCARVCEEVENEKKGIGSKVAWDFGHGAGIAAAAIRKGEP